MKTKLEKLNLDLFKKNAISNLTAINIKGGTDAEITADDTYEIEDYSSERAVPTRRHQPTNDGSGHWVCDHSRDNI